MKNIQIDITDEKVKIGTDADLTNHELILTWHFLTQLIIEHSRKKDITRAELINLVNLSFLEVKHDPELL